jgi:hypothetical protein
LSNTVPLSTERTSTVAIWSNGTLVVPVGSAVWPGPALQVAISVEVPAASVTHMEYCRGEVDG